MNAESNTRVAATSTEAREPELAIPRTSAASGHQHVCRIVVFSSLFPSETTPAAGVFIRERMFRVARRVPLVVVAPQAWSPFDWLVRLKRRSFRPMAPSYEVMDGVEVYRPRFLSLPGMLKRLDGASMAVGSARVVRQLLSSFRPTLIDAHFLYPDGYAATRLGKRFGLPATITIRGSKDEWLIGTDREPYLRIALQAAARLFAVSDALKRDVAIRLGTPGEKVQVIGNGVDLSRFVPVERGEARARLGLAPAARVVISVGGLIERKGFHRIIPLLPALRKRIPGLVYLIVGGGTTQGDIEARLRLLAKEHGVADIVRFCGPQRPDDLKWFYGAADVFALATQHEGWANVFLEAMACGLPVITTRVGGNAEVVANGCLGTLVDYWDAVGFADALGSALERNWDRSVIMTYAHANRWDERIDVLVDALQGVSDRSEAHRAEWASF
jgi:teichuronic acid biosynthesis glycosyltransferase TuaC